MNKQYCQICITFYNVQRALPPISLFDSCNISKVTGFVTWQQASQQ